ncbi:MAG: ABC transporter permease [Lachnospiraceae bacterium]|nr:ABC transporter permease [Lachnospiraceae bacterium]
MNPIFIRYTWKTLRKNYSRTLVTVIGIILSVALLTAVTVSISSALYYFSRVALSETGDWCVNVYAADEETLRKIAEDRRVTGLSVMRTVGYAAVDSVNENKPYLFIGAVGDDFAQRMPVVITSGRMPQTDTELIVPEHLLQNGGVELELGQQLILTPGQRTGATGDERETLNQHDPFFAAGSGSEAQERLTAGAQTVTYTVTGFYERPGFEDRHAPGYTALTADRTDGELPGSVYEVWVQLKNVGMAEEFVREQTSAGNAAQENQTLLKYMGKKSNAGVSLLYAMAAILMTMVMVGSVSLIYNAFSISVTERTKQFGLLKSLGATRRQILGSVLTEGLMLCVVGLPAGALTGCAGIAATIWACRDLFETVLSRFAKGVMFEVHPTVTALGLSLASGLLTVLISAWLPARKALRMPAMEAIRQTQDIRIRPGTVRVNPLAARLFGLEGMLAAKNFRRSRKRYRATIFSLFFSIVLFICADSFCHYLKKGVEDSRASEAYDLCCELDPADGEVKTRFGELAALDGVDDGILMLRQYMNVRISPQDMTPEYRRFHDSHWGTPWSYCQVKFVEEETYRAYLERNGLDPAVYLDLENPTALVYDRVVLSWDNTNMVCHMFKPGAQELGVCLVKELDGWSEGWPYLTEDGKEVVRYRENGPGDEKQELPFSEAVQVKEVKVGEILEEAPWFSAGLGYAQIFLPESLMERWGISAERYRYSAYFMAQNYDRVYEEMVKISTQEGGGFVMNNAAEVVINRAIILLVEIFAAGFLILISLISAANVFNTISTNVMLRRREFAMLTSVGMTFRGLRAILNYECLLYGMKSFLYAAPVSVGITWLIYERVKGEGYFIRFYIPWQTILTAILALFAVVSVTMLYAAKKIRRRDLAGALREENT